MNMKKLENKTVLIWKMAIVSAISWKVAKLVGSEHPYLAPLSVFLCLQSTNNQSIALIFHSQYCGNCGRFNIWGLATSKQRNC
ncbi:hypothetical protein MEZE111188_05005 [Mesobacillus zeae]